MPETLDRSLSSVSLNSIPEDDWDRSLPDIKDNSIVFPVNETPGKSSRYSHSKTASVQDGKGDRNLSELLRFHLEENSKGHFSAEEAARIADVLGQWINASSSPYEAEDDSFAPSGQSMGITSKRQSQVDSNSGRPQGRSECTNPPSISRPPSSTHLIPS